MGVVVGGAYVWFTGGESEHVGEERRESKVPCIIRRGENRCSAQPPPSDSQPNTLCGIRSCHLPPVYTFSNKLKGGGWEANRYSPQLFIFY